MSRTAFTIFSVILTLCVVCWAVISFLPFAWVGPKIVPQAMLKNMNGPVHYTGTIWNGALVSPEAQVDFSLSPRRYFGRQPIATFSGAGFGMVGSGGARPGHMKDVKISGPVAPLLSSNRTLYGAKGVFDLNLASLKFSPACEAANGTFETDMLQRNQQNWRWQGPKMSGPIRCVDGNLVVSLSGADTDQTIEAEITLLPGGMYRADVKVQTRRPEAASILPLLGFSENGGGYTLSEQGAWQ